MSSAAPRPGRRPWLRDLLLLGLPLLAVPGLAPEREPAGVVAARYPDVVLLGGLGALALLARRRHPWPVLALATVLGVAALVRNQGPTPFLLPALLALFAVAARTTRARAVAATVAVGAVLAVAAVVATGDSWNAPTVVVLPQLAALAGALGLVAGQRRAYLEAVEERAERAERTREEEARRRVAEERLRIARELHDVVAHHMAVVNVQAGAAGHLLRSDPDEAERSLAQIRRSGRVVLDELAALLTVLRGGEEAEGAEGAEPAPGLAQLPELLDGLGSAGLSVRSTVRGRPRPLAPTVDLVAYRVLQEALTNAAKHGTGTATALVAYEDATLLLAVDNPYGPYGPHGPHSPGGGGGTGHGLIGMRERAAAVGGTLQAGPCDDGTWRVRADLPTDQGER